MVFTIFILHFYSLQGRPSWDIQQEEEWEVGMHPEDNGEDESVDEKENTCKFYLFKQQNKIHNTRGHSTQTFLLTFKNVRLIQNAAGSELDELTFLYALVAGNDHTLAITLPDLVPPLLLDPQHPFLQVYIYPSYYKM